MSIIKKNHVLNRGGNGGSGSGNGGGQQSDPPKLN